MATTNTLITSHSPYLLQHADNPIAWQEYNDSTIRLAQTLDLPIFLSIGYSSCHWCHVLAEESFSQDELATVLNPHFISIKVDRELSPDVDMFYITCSEIMTSTAGWPLQVFLTPQGHPLFSFTYMHKNDIITTAKKIIELCKDTDVCQIAEHIFQHATSILHEVPPPRPLFLASRNLALSRIEHRIRRWDYHHTGFISSGPKFIPYDFLRLASDFGDSQHGHIVHRCMDKLLHSGVYDIVGGGVFRYSTSPDLVIPHFEKMLYDQAQFLLILAMDYAKFPSERVSQAIDKHYTFLLREMRSAEGFFYSSIDADSPEGEGKYYLYNRREAELVTDHINNSEVVLDALGILDRPGGKGSLEVDSYDYNAHLVGNLEQLFIARDLDPSTASVVLDEVVKELFKLRQHRSPPAVDLKALLSWNGLMVVALCEVHKATKRIDVLAIAVNTASVCYNVLRDENVDPAVEVHLKRSYHHGNLTAQAFLDDVAFFFWACVELSAVLSDVPSLLCRLYPDENARNMNGSSVLKELFLNYSLDVLKSITTHFLDPETHHLFFNSKNSNPIVPQIVNIRSGGNIFEPVPVVIESLLQLFEVTKDDQHLVLARSIAKSFSGVENPSDGLIHSFALMSKYLD
ncbi:hypothetical protein RCL1_001931 [Eukaryota sp. TZLM3-RCL]